MAVATSLLKTHQQHYAHATQQLTVFPRLPDDTKTCISECTLIRRGRPGGEEVICTIPVALGPYAGKKSGFVD